MAKNEITAVVKVKSDGGLEKVAGNAGKAAAALDKAGKSAHSADRGIKGASEQSSNATKNFSKMAQGISGPVVKAYATLAANLFAIGAAFRYLERAADYGSMIQAQKNYAATMGTSLNTITKSLQGASHGMLDYAASAKIAGLAVAAGLNIKQLEDYANSARAVADVLGEDYETTLKRLVKATASGRTTLLREIGVTVDAKKAKEEYGKSIGKLGKDLTEFEQKQSIIIETQRQLNATFGDTAATANPFTILLAAITDITTEMTQKVLPIFELVVNTLSKSIIGVITVLGYLAVSIMAPVLNITGLQKKFETWGAKAASAIEAAKDRLEGTREIVKALSEDFDDMKRRSTEALQASAKTAMQEGGTSPVFKKLAAGKSQQPQLTAAFNAKALKAELETAEAHTKDYVIKSEGMFKGLRASIVREMRLAHGALGQTLDEHTAIQKASISLITKWWTVGWNTIRLKAVQAISGIVTAVSTLSKAMTKVLRLFSGFGIATIFYEMGKSLLANIHSIAMGVLDIIESMFSYFDEQVAKLIDKLPDFLKGKPTPAPSWAEGPGDWVNGDWVPKEDQISAIDKLRGSLDGLLKVQNWMQGIENAEAAFKELKDTIKANTKDIEEFKRASQNVNLTELQKAMIQINSVGSLSLSNVLEKIIPMDEGAKKTELLREFSKNLEGIASVSNDPRLQALSEALSMPGVNLQEVASGLFVVEQQSQALGSSFQNFKQEVGNFSWDNLTSGNFAPLLASLYDITKKQKEIVIQARLLNKGSIEQEALSLANYNNIIAAVKQLVDTEQAISLEKVHQEALLNSIEGNQSAQVSVLRDQINIEKTRLEIASKINTLAGIDLRINNELKTLDTEKAAALKAQRDLLVAQIEADTLKVKRMTEQLVIQAQLYQLEEDSTFLEKAKEELDVQKEILDIRKSILDTERNIALERAKIAGMALGGEGASAVDELSIFNAQKEARLELIRQEAEQKRLQLDAEYELMRLKSEQETLQFQLRNQSVADELEARLQLLNKEMAARYDILNKEAEARKVAGPGAAPTITMDTSALSKSNSLIAIFEKAQSRILEKQKELKKEKEKQIDAEEELAKLQLKTEGLDKQLAVIDEIKNSFSDILGLAKGTSLEGIFDPLIESGAAVVGMYKAQQELALEAAAEFIAIEEEKVKTISDIRAAEAQRDFKTAQKYSDKLQDLNAETAAQSVRVEKAKTKSNIAMAGTMAQGIGSALTALAATQDQTSKKGFESAKKMNMAAAIVNTAGAIMNAMATVQPYPAALAAAAVAAAVGAAQIAAISKTSFGGSGSAPTVGASGSSSSGGTPSSQRTQGTGSVFGDSDAKSESILNATEITAEATSKLVGINQDMLVALRNMQTGIVGAVTQITRAGDPFNINLSSLYTGDPLGFAADGAYLPGDLLRESLGKLGGVGETLADLGSIPFDLVGKVIDWASGLIGGSASVRDEGVQILGGTMGEMIDDIMVQSFQTIRSKKYAWSRSKTNDYFGDAGAVVEEQFSLIFESIKESVFAGASALGVGTAEEITAAIDNFLLETIRISTLGLTPEEEIAEFQAVFGKVFDDLSESVVPWLSELAALGEGPGETLARVATNVQVMDEAMSRLGFSMEIPQTYIDGQHEIQAATSYTAMLAAEAATALIEAAGGLEKFIDGMSNFIDKFASDEYQFELRTSDLSRSLERAGIEVIPATRDAMWELMQTLDAGTESGRAQIATMLSLSDMADAYYSFIESAQEKQFDLEVEVMNLTGQGLRAVTLEREKEIASLQEIDDVLGSNLALTQKYVYGLQDRKVTEDIYLNLLKATNNSVTALNIERQREISLLNEQAATYQRLLNDVNDVNSMIDMLSKAFQALGQEDTTTAIQFKGVDDDSLLAQVTRVTGDIIRLSNDLSRAESNRAKVLGDISSALKSAIDVEKARLQALHDAAVRTRDGIGSLMLEAYNAIGDTKSARDFGRQFESDKRGEPLDASDPLYKMQDAVWKLTDAVDAHNDAVANREEVMSRATDAVNKAYDAEEKRIQALHDAAAAALTDAEGLLRRSFAAEKEILIAEFEEASQALADKIGIVKSIINSIDSAMKSLSGTVAQLQQNSLDVFRKNVQDLRGITEEIKGGNLSNIDKVSDIINNLKAPEEGQFSTREDYDRESLKALIALEELDKVLGSSESTEDQILKTLETQLADMKEAHINELKGLDDQLDAILGVDKSITDLDSAITKYQDAKALVDSIDLDNQLESLRNQRDLLLNGEETIKSIEEATADYIAQDMLTQASVDATKASVDTLTTSFLALTNSYEPAAQAVRNLDLEASLAQLDQLYEQTVGINNVNGSIQQLIAAYTAADASTRANIAAIEDQLDDAAADLPDLSTRVTDQATTVKDRVDNTPPPVTSPTLDTGGSATSTAITASVSSQAVLNDIGQRILGRSASVEELNSFGTELDKGNITPIELEFAARSSKEAQSRVASLLQGMENKVLSGAELAKLYLDANPDVWRAIAVGQIKDAWGHFISSGWTEGRMSESAYLSANPDVAESLRTGAHGLVNAADHFIKSGHAESRTGVLFTNNVPGYAEGGTHSGGWRVVGERGPELEYTGSSQIFSNRDSLFDNSDVVSELVKIRRDLTELGDEVVANSNKVTKLMEKWDIIGLPVIIEEADVTQSLLAV